MKKFEPHYRLVRVGAAQKIEKASRQQRTSYPITYTFESSPLCFQNGSEENLILITAIAPQGNNERTEKRSFGVQQRRRVHPRTRRNKRVVSCGGSHGAGRGQREDEEGVVGRDYSRARKILATLLFCQAEVAWRTWSRQKLENYYYLHLLNDNVIKSCHSYQFVLIARRARRGGGEKRRRHNKPSSNQAKSKIRQEYSPKKRVTQKSSEIKAVRIAFRWVTFHQRRWS